MRLASEFPVIDVRTPDEYRSGHIPGAISHPLFDDKERALVGTAYATEGKETATRIGLDLVGPRMSKIIDGVRDRVGTGRVLVHCWRGGMRSESVAWLLNFSGEFQASTLDGGYKAYRNFALGEFARQRKLIILGGMTGSGKTDILKELAILGEQVVDLEGLASHRGSAFGSIGLTDQPTQQQFENELAWALFHTDPSRHLWLEDESRRIGRAILPEALWGSMRQADCIALERPRTERNAHLVSDYGQADHQLLAESVGRIERRLGGDNARQAIAAILENDLSTACDILLDYYDKTYLYGLSRRDPEAVHALATDGQSAKETAERLLEVAASIGAHASEPAGESTIDN